MVASKKTAKSIKITDSSSSAVSAKETIYIDVEDDITNIIDSVKSSGSKIVVLVLPKRANALQSLVNMKLLKRSATSAKKNIVLVTSESGLMPLAGAAGIHVAKTPQSKPEIPGVSRQTVAHEVESIEEGEYTVDKTKSVGAAQREALSVDDDVIEFDNIKTDDIDNEASTRSSKKAKGGKKDKKLKVPSFDKFKLGVGLAVLAVVLLVGGWILAFVVLPKATITIKTDTDTAVSSFDFTASALVDSVDTSAMKIPAVAEQIKKTETEKSATTGQRDDGARASGEVTLSAECSPSSFGLTIPTGTAVSSGGLNYITQERAVLNNIGSGCILSDTVKVLAPENGDKYNIPSNKTFTVAGFANVTGKNSSEIDGGSSKIVKIVTQKDIDDAVNKISQKLDDSIKADLKSKHISNNVLPLDATYLASEPVVKPNVEVDKEADEVTVSYEATYTMLGVNRKQLAELVRSDVEKDGELDLSKQSIIDDGIDKAIMRINNSKADQAYINLRTSVIAGPELNEEEIKDNVRGKKVGEIESYVKSLTGVQDVSVKYSPFWVYSTPKAAKKIILTIEKPELPDLGSNGNSSGGSE